MNNQFIRALAVLCAAASLCLMPVSEARSEGFALYEYGSRGVALGGAVIARKPDVTAMAFNPALLGRLPGTHAAAGLTMIYPRGKMEYSDPALEDTRLKRSLWPIPHAYFSHQLSEDWTLGVGEFSRFGLGFEYPHNWPGRFNVYEVALTTASLNPVIAWKATDALSLAAGIELVYVSLDLKKRQKMPEDSPIWAEVDASITAADDVGFGFNLAAHYQFNEQWAAGAHYRSKVRVHAYGDMEFAYLGANDPAYEAALQAGYNAAFRDGTAHARVVLPESAAAGISWTPVPEFSVEVGAIWTRWSRFQHLNIHLPGSLGVSENNKDWRDTWRFNVGLEYDALDWLTLRLGYAYDQSPMREPYDDYLVPTRNRHIYSGGLGFSFDAWKIDLAYSIICPAMRHYKAKPEYGVLDSTTKDSYTQTFGVTVAYEF